MRENSPQLTQLTPQDVARYCGVSTQTVDDWLKKGRLEGHDEGGVRCVAAATLIDFMDENNLAIPTDLTVLSTHAVNDAPFTSAPEYHESFSAIVVDSDNQISTAIEDILKDLGLATVRVANALDAGAKYKYSQPKLITLELEAGDLSGIELIENIQMSQAGTKILVVSNQMPSTLVKAKSAGADAIITKPFDNDTLKRTVKILLNL